jgi:hypothetical protein
VDSGATAANVKTGTVGYLRAGFSVKTVLATVAGSGQTPGVYTVAANVGSGGGSGAIIQVTVLANGTVALGAVTVLQGGLGYSTLPTFTLAAGGTPATLVAQLNSTMNIVTSVDQASLFNTVVRPVVFLNSITPGNFGFVQELGTATVLNSAAGAITAGNFVNAASNGNGTVSSGATTFIPTTIGIAIDAGVASQPFKILLTTPPIQD